MNVGEQTRVDVATGGRPKEALERAIDAWGEGPALVQVAAFHDTGCPTVDNNRLDACTCEIVVLVGRRLA